MTFNSKNYKKNSFLYNSNKFGSDNSINQPELEADRLINELKILFLEFNKEYDILKDYDKKLESLTETEYVKRSQIAHYTIESIHKNLKEINNIIIRFETLQIEDKELKSKLIENMKIVNNKIRPKQEDLSNLIFNITKKEKAKNDHLVMSLKSRTNSTLNNPKSNTTGSLFSNNAVKLSNVDSNKLNLDQQLLEMHNEPLIYAKDIAFIEQLSKERESDLKHIQTVSGQIKDMSLFMNDKVKTQGNLLSNIIYL